jgi:hypothetical protein
LAWVTGFGVAIVCAGCTNIVDAVVDDVVDPGGKLTTTLNTQSLGDVTALAKGNPLAITGMGATYIISMTVGDDATGRTGFDTFATANQSLTIQIAAGSRNQLQTHFGGQSCVATDGQLVLSTDSNKDIGGTFQANGTQSSDGKPCTLSGTLMAIPQSR